MSKLAVCLFIFSLLVSCKTKSKDYITFIEHELGEITKIEFQKNEKTELASTNDNKIKRFISEIFNAHLSKRNKKETRIKNNKKIIFYRSDGSMLSFTYKGNMLSHKTGYYRQTFIIRKKIEEIFGVLDFDYSVPEP